LLELCGSLIDRRRRRTDLPPLSLVSILRPTLSRSLSAWFHHLGGPGLILLGLIDSSAVPIPGSMDALTIVLAAEQRELWPYYALMATIGSVFGGYLTFRLARTQGKAALAHKLSRSNMKKAHDIFGKWGFGAIAIPAVLPPPVPIVPFVLAAGATQYSPRKFLVALTLGRTVRYSALAFVAAFYGRRMWTLISRHGWTILWVAITLAAIGAVASMFLRIKGRSKRPA
jgi:membrane protein YqaA with SNARE-associated domain